jgi:ABC-type glycerol-3-phosphate transport system substrate-binding protein
MVAAPSWAEELVIWHDKGDDGIRMIQQMAEVYKKDHPDITIRSLSFPTDQWFSKVIAALNTDTAPDIIFNDDTRIVRIQQTTGKVEDLGAELKALPEGDRKFISDADLAAGTLEGHLLMMPFQRTITGWGVRKSWLDKVGEKYPVTWEDNLRVAKKFQTEDPDGNGKNDTYGMAWQAGNAPSMLGAGINLLVFGNGAEHSLIDEDGKVIIEQPEIAAPTIEYLKLFTEYKLVAPDTVNHTFTDMYQLIEGGRAGMFRVGNWNVAKWDKETITGDYLVGAYPTFGHDGKGAMVIGSVRGMAVPTNSPHAEAARQFVEFLVSRPAQQFSLENMGGVIRTDLDTSKVTPSLKPFVDPDTKLASTDFMTAKYPWYPALQEAYYKILIGAVSNPPADWNAWIKDTASQLEAEVEKLKSKG